MVNQNKIFSFKIKRQAKNVFPRDVERTVGTVSSQHSSPVELIQIWWIYLQILYWDFEAKEEHYPNLRNIEKYH